MRTLDLPNSALNRSGKLGQFLRKDFQFLALIWNFSSSKTFPFFNEKLKSMIKIFLTYFLLILDNFPFKKMIPIFENSQPKWGKEGFFKDFPLWMQLLLLFRSQICCIFQIISLWDVNSFIEEITLGMFTKLQISCRNILIIGKIYVEFSQPLNRSSFKSWEISWANIKKLAGNF